MTNKPYKEYVQKPINPDKLAPKIAVPKHSKGDHPKARRIRVWKKGLIK